MTALDPERARRAAAALAEGRARIRSGPEPETLVVGSFAGDGTYLVDVERESCTCPDARIRGARCKHLLAALLAGRAP